MDKNAIKKYAVWARRELIKKVSQKAMQYEIEDGKELNANATSVNGQLLTDTEKKQRTALVKKIQGSGYEQVMEEVAYTWFNRFAALRFMEVNGYLPSHVRVFTNEEGAFQPQILSEAIHLELDGLDMEKVYSLKNANQNEELYKYLLITQCNALNGILPGMFQKIADYTELLLPDNLLREGSAIEQMVSQIPEEDWTDQVQIIGWLYQYYNSEKKDDVFAALKNNVKITKENIPAATQLFTPDWIVRYMVENSLGRLWVEGHPNAELQAQWKYYLEEAAQEPEVEAQLAEIRKEYANLTPEQIKCIDPCMGSGHILAYLFDVLVQIYEAYGFPGREAAASIVEHNLYGLDIDDRAAQLAYFTVMMKARQYDRRFFSRDIQPHVYAIAESNHVEQMALDTFCNGDAGLQSAMDTIVTELHDAKEYGSILTVTEQDWSALYARFEEIKNSIGMFHDAVMSQVLPLVQVAETLAQKYDVVVTNPPYMKEDNMSEKLHELVLNSWPDAKYDIYAVFQLCCYEKIKMHGIMSMITMHNFMFSPSFLKHRKKLWKYDWINMVHLGSHAFSEINGEVVQTAAYTVSKKYTSRKCVIVDLSDIKSAEKKEKQFISEKIHRYEFNLAETNYIPWLAMGYALSDKIMQFYKEDLTLERFSETKAGVVTGDDEYFCKLWHEVIYPDITRYPAPTKLYKYVPFSRGGTFVSWYGNTHHVLRILDMWDDKLTNKSVRRGDINYYYKRGIGWSQMGGGVNKSYSLIEESICKTTTPMLYADETKLKFILAYLNSPIPTKILKSLNPTLSILISDIQHLPYVSDCTELETINDIVDICIDLAKINAFSYETSWDFTRHPLVPSAYEKQEQLSSQFAESRMAKFGLLSWHYERWKQECNDRFDQLKANEVELNRIFIDIYGLQDELTPEVADKDITVHRLFDTKDEVPESMGSSNYIRTKRDEVISLISYAVGCMFGRYSLDVDGLAYAGGDWDDCKYTSYPADRDNIIPICDDEYFEDDIVGCFVDFVGTVYGEDTLEENLQFVANALGGSGQPREVIRNYFLNDFYTDHCKTYQKRPIYWLFDSGKKNGFKCLIYMHRYQPDTIARIRTDYVHEQQSRYRTAIDGLEHRMGDASSSERVKLSKQLKKLQDQSVEIHDYEEKIHHLADQMISIDLDDGVKVNYAKFQDVLAKIK